jgi:hypothetical protein
MSFLQNVGYLIATRNGRLGRPEGQPRRPEVKSQPMRYWSAAGVSGWQTSVAAWSRALRIVVSLLPLGGHHVVDLPRRLELG